jgi:hypothetical protein
LLGSAALAFCAWAASTAGARTLHSLVTVTVTGPGNVYAPAPDPTSGSISCPAANCSAYMKQDTTVTFTATPDGNATFAGWGESCAAFGTNPACTLTMAPGDSKTDITAGFNEAPPPPPMETLSIAKSGTGTGYVGGAGGIDCGPTCSGSFVQGSKVVLTAVPDDGSDFTGWSGGGCSGTETCSVTLDANTDVTATFTHVDRDPPHLKTLAASSAPGKTAALRFRVFDDSGKSGETFTILQGKKTIGRVTVRLGPVNYRQVHTIHWLVPARMKPGRRLFCGVATDAAGNRSTRSCSLLRIR